MDVEYFQEGLDCLMYNGMKLSPEEKVLVENSLLVLQTEHRFARVYFWGRINALKEDYYIAFGYVTDCLKDRKFFYSLDGHQWLMLPFICNPEIFQATLMCQEPFMGDPSLIVKVRLDCKYIVNPYAALPTSFTVPEMIQLKEEDRLAAIVFIISEECAICPRGALYKLIDGRVVANGMFRGLTDLQAEDLSYYQIYRLPRNEMKQNLSKRSDYNYAIDFLDTVDDIIPCGQSFSLNLERNERLVVIKSCLWIGMTFFHKLRSHKFGFLYFGDGKRNLDLLLMH